MMREILNRKLVRRIGHEFAFRESGTPVLRQLVAEPSEFVVALADSSRGVRRPPKRHLAVGDRDVRVVVLRLGELGDPVHERDRLAEGREFVRSLERSVDFLPVVHDRSIAVGEVRTRCGRDTNE